MSGEIARIRVGSTSRTKLKKKKLCIENSVHAVRSSIEEGIVSGVGIFLIHLNHELLDWTPKNLKGDEHIGAKIIAKSVLFPVFF